MADPVGVWLRMRREELGLSRQQIVTRLRGTVSYSHLTKVEQGERKPTAEVLRLLAPAYRVDVAHLLKVAGLLDADTKTREPQPVEPDPRDPKSLVRWLRGDPNISDDDRRVIADVYERLRRRQE